MSLEKAIASGKEHRKQYYQFCKVIDPSCRNHGNCAYCKQNRLYNTKRRLQKAEYIDNE